MEQLSERKDSVSVWIFKVRSDFFLKEVFYSRTEAGGFTAGVNA